MARRLGGFWRGRACVPATGCFGRNGRGRKRGRVWLALWAGIIALLVLIVILVVVLTRRHSDKPEAHTIWVNLTNFPPMPTGILTVVGPDNSLSRSACTEPTTLWSCSLPKDQQDSVSPYNANQPTVVMQIEWDNKTRNAKDALVRTRAIRTVNNLLRGRQTALDFKLEPHAPDVKEVWFLGNTKDKVQSDQQAGEPTPFYISLIKSAHGTAESSTLARRGNSPQVGKESVKHLLPAPDLEADGTPSPAVMLPSPAQQPMRLFDHGLATENYAFYTHFRRTIFLKSVTVLNKTEKDNIPADEDGGCRKDEAGYVVTWGETRMLVQIWTRALDLNASALLRPDEGSGIKAGALMRPGTMPYPVTVTLDTHGGDAKRKLVWSRPLDKRQHISLDEATLLSNNMNTAGSWINPRGTGDARLGGFDGGTGG